MAVDRHASRVYSRRDFGRLTLAGVPLSLAPRQRGPGRIDSTIGGVLIGVQSFSFRSLPATDAIIAAIADIGLGSVELMSNHAEAAAGAPRGAEAVRSWRRSASDDAFTAVRRTFEAAGIDVALLCYNIGRETADDEVEYAFRMARALGVRGITTSSQVSVAKRIAPFAEKHRMMVGFHNHHHSDGSDPDEVATPESFEACTSLSKYHGINLDIGHFTASNFDAVPYIEKHHARITNVHLKDRKRNAGAIVPWGTGDAPLKEVLQLMRAKRYRFPANIEYEYRGGDAVAEVRKCFQFCKDALAS